jgi:serine/threonine protein kinase
MTAAPATELGIVVGTVAYMSPDQAQGRPIGERSDIFSFGAVLYEMLAGRRPFTGDSSVVTVASILTQTPTPISSSRSDVPRALEALITACLEKPPARRPNAREVVDQPSRLGGGGGRPTHASAGRERLPFRKSAASPSAKTWTARTVSRFRPATFCPTIRSSRCSMEDTSRGCRTSSARFSTGWIGYLGPVTPA